ncbi:hypothetical protein SAMD00019534_013800 [Acytostelium subglobosum LB1]|uniref:hypothetical protein n=1 Tax=Acytostelium subglobosum LB1 TaxID=1410327 RepID=UPI000644E3D0|nr:hypothetical protein SAMD00019534_013800 [Acytostelium subglobosum LB1]GAM18205.1 hypothetical protein SAMD00019534_013800 [Acytostelium subglobosum LB1]|eukprot:XP_012758801.1 hypothetical protein SAMD00019534_013800 [Acytostelium subglobosum LB1]
MSLTKESTPDQVSAWLKHKNLDDATIKALRDQDIAGKNFIKLTRARLLSPPYSFKDAVVDDILDAIEEITGTSSQAPGAAGVGGGQVPKRYFDDIFVAEYEGRLKKVKFDGPIVTLPASPSSLSTDRTRFDFKDNQVKIVKRAITDRLMNFITDKYGKHRGVYVQGPQGVGKSHSLFQIASALKQNIGNRVLYISDCRGWLGSSNPFQFFLECLDNAFQYAGDNFVRDHSRRNSFEQDSLLRLLDDVARHCTDKNLRAFFFFDQHNGLSDNDRKLAPFSIVEGYLVVSIMWIKQLVIVSGSANNRYFLKVAKDSNWPVFQFTDGYTDDEFKQWQAIEKKFATLTPDDIELVKDLTNFIP